MKQRQQPHERHLHTKTARRVRLTVTLCIAPTFRPTCAQTCEQCIPLRSPLRVHVQTLLLNERRPRQQHIHVAEVFVPVRPLYFRGTTASSDSAGIGQENTHASTTNTYTSTPSHRTFNITHHQQKVFAVNQIYNSDESSGAPGSQHIKSKWGGGEGGHS